MRLLATAAASALLLGLSACGGGGGGSGGSGGSTTTPSTPAQSQSPSNTPAGHAVGGSVSGLAGKGLVLQNNAGDDLSVNADGGFVFPASLQQGAAYAVTVKTQPADPVQTCTVNMGSGSIGDADVSNVAVVCATRSFAVGGSVSGLKGSGLVIQNNSGGDVTVPADGSFRFADAVASGANYAVTVKSQPQNPTQVCSVSKGSGRMVDAAIDDVNIVCSTESFAVGGSVSGLVGSGLKLQNNAGDDIAVNGNGNFAFSQTVASGAGFAVTVAQQPTSPSQTCTVNNGAGTIGAGAVNNVSVNCSINSYSVKLKVSGLDGVGLVLQNNDGDDLPVSANGDHMFTAPVASGTSYAVKVKTQPTLVSQTCSVINGSGSITNADVSDVTVDCLSRIASFMHVASQGISLKGALSAYSIDPVTGLPGAAPAADPAPTDFAPLSVAVADSGKFAWVLSAGGKLDQFAVASSGAATALSPARVSVSATSSALVLDPKGRFVYAIDMFQGSGNQGRLTALAIGQDGTLSAKPRVDVGVAPIAYAADPTGRYMYVANNGKYIGVHPVGEDGLAGATSSANVNAFVLALAANPDGRKVYALTTDTEGVKGCVSDWILRRGSGDGLTSCTQDRIQLQSFDIDQGDGSLTASGMPLSVGSAVGLKVHPNGRFVYALMANGAVRTFTVDANSGALNETSHTDALGEPLLAAQIDPAGRYAYALTATQGMQMAAIDHATGALVPQGPVLSAPRNTALTAAALGQ
ncbi:beta-propeller fold lactonase family protein [Variovorax dokdonensis]|uniref:Beta-propeller fold lactonase family protein n=1 Tax=Variovorax dokdonensis TaxID=344883 RepID=A0ABT7NE90_9BURK|nr:beta-propeller fold lactonase family protein [Variovorax dokdonensis]MDM0046253.1 beta-propeller fold lactonase family protein [Variovorax dokdonensis]